MKIQLIVFTFTWFNGLSQTAKTIEILESQYQVCLDKGKFMLGCSKSFYFQMDSLLNAQYKNLIAKCDKIQKNHLKKEQTKWLELRDKQFKHNKQEVHNEAKVRGYEGGQDEIMILTDKNAMFIKDRVIELIGKTPDSYSEKNYKSKRYNVSND